MISLKSRLSRACCRTVLLGVFAYLFVSCSDMMTEPLTEGGQAGPKVDLSALSFSVGGKLTVGSHTNLLDWDDEDDFAGPTPLADVAVRVRDANGTLLLSGSTSSTGEFSVQTSQIPARLEFELADRTTYTIALGSVDAGTNVVRSKLAYQDEQRALNAEIIPDDDLNAVADDGMATRVVGRIADNSGSGQVTTTAAEQIDATAGELESIVVGNPGTPLADKVEDALAKTRKAASELDKTTPDQEAAIGALEGAVGDLEAVVKDGLLDATAGARHIGQLVVAGRQLATQTLDQAIARGRHADKIREAQKSVAEGDGLRSSGRAKDALGKYKDALSKARSALS